ncbi:MAG: methyltransferase domain-containing protein [Christensenellales bacterium]|jgi:SAM-dependent methyltransferase
MDYSQRISHRQWNQPDKGVRESQRERTFIDDIVQKDHLQRALLDSLEGVRTVFDGGAGSGRFSILLAQRGLSVTHFDISAPMIDQAREAAQAAGALDRITFVQGALEDLSAYADGAFDLVISFDAPICYTYPNHERVIASLARIARKRLLVSVASRLGALPYRANPLQKHPYILSDQPEDPWARWCLEHEADLVEDFRFDKAGAEDFLARGGFGEEEAIAAYEAGEAPWPITYHFMPDELKRILAANGLRDVRLAGPGAYARTLPRPILRKLMADPDQRRDFLDFCYQYDQNPYVLGMGKDNLLARGEK